MIELREDGITRYRCHTGHAFTASALLAGITESAETLLLQGMRALEEATMLLNRLGDQYEREGQAERAAPFRQQAEEARRRSRRVHRALTHNELLSEDSLLDAGLEESGPNAARRKPSPG